MEKRENSKLLVDIGMGFHPNPVDKTTLVFLSDLEQVNQSYDAAGMNAGKCTCEGDTMTMTLLTTEILQRV